MKAKHNTKNYIFKGLQIISWIIFIGLCIEAGGLVVNFVFSLARPEFIPRLYQNLDLSDLYESSKLVFLGMYGFVLTLAVLKAIMFYIVILLITKIDLAKPFDHLVSDRIFKISHYTLAIGVVGLIAQQIATGLQQQGFSLDILKPFWGDSEAYILMAAVIYSIGSIFLKGVEYQDELEETV